jgi:hypothetical protein
MGCCNDNSITIKEVNNNSMYYEAFEIMKDLLNLIEENKQIKDCYLIKSDSFFNNNFFDLIKQYKDKDINKNDNQNKLREEINNLAFDSTKIIFLNEYNECKKLMGDNNNGENFFCIVNKSFINKMNIKIGQNTKNKKVTIGSNMTITFNDGKTINFKEKKFGYFKFVNQKLNKIITIADTENISNNTIQNINYSKVKVFSGKPDKGQVIILNDNKNIKLDRISKDSNIINNDINNDRY